MKLKGVGLVILKIIYAVGCFTGFLFLFSFLLNQGNADMTGTMKEATYPVVYFNLDGYGLNRLHGNAKAMDTAYLKDGILPIKKDRKISLTIDTYGTPVDKIRYEIRNMTGDRLIENTDVYNYLTDGNIITADITIKDLIDEYEKYSFCVILQASNGNEIRYYMTIEEADAYDAGDKLAFAYYFTKTSFDKVETREDLKKYMETNAKGNNSSFHHVDIHSNLEQVSWGNTGAQPASEPMATLLEIDDSSAIVKVDYYISTGEGDDKNYYAVSDVYRMTNGKERMFLYDFEREVNQIFSLSNAVMTNNKIMLGITDENVEMVESPDGNQLAFANSGRLYSYNIADNKLAYIFGFYDDNQQTDVRYGYLDHDIKIYSVDANGNVYFMVYGYMNRGDHEGQMGISVFYYDSVINNVEEKVFIPYDRSYEFLKETVNTLSFVNQAGEAFIFMNDSLYKILLDDVSSNPVVQNIPYGGLKVSDDGTMAAWISGGDINNASQVVLLNMTTGRQTYVQAGDDNRIRAVGFFGNDLIYGLAKKSDIQLLSGDKSLFPMYSLVIRDEEGNILKDYEQSGVYVMDTVIDDTMLTLERAEKAEGTFINISDDQILNNKSKHSGKNSTEKVITENFETIVQVVVKNEIKTKTMQILTPKFVIFEGERIINLDGESDNKCYYLYSKGKLVSTYKDSNEAINIAYDEYGSVIDDKGRYLYIHESVPSKNQIMTITEHSINDDDDAYVSRAVCLNILLEINGVSTDTRSAVRNNMSSMQIISEKAPEIEVVNLTGCPSEVYKYYVSKNIPVMVTSKDNTGMLIMGYNEIGYFYMDPVAGTIYRKGFDETEKYIKENAVEVFTYIK